MSLDIAALVEDPVVRTRVVAGKSGLSRPILWAHTCELADPWNWMGSGDLLMTDGYGLPEGAEAQVDFITSLAAAGLAGITIAEGFAAPLLTPEAKDAADRLSFPVLTTARSVPFVTVARIVADRNQGASGSRAAKLLRVYDVLRRVHSGEVTGDYQLLDLLGEELHARLHVIDFVRGRELIPTDRDLEPELRTAILTCIREKDRHLPGVTRVAHDDDTVLVVPVGEGQSVALIVQLDRIHSMDLVLVQHAAMIVGLEVERRAVWSARRRDQGADLLRRMLEGTVEPQSAQVQLQSLGLSAGPWRVTAWERNEPKDASAGTSGSDLNEGDTVAAAIADGLAAGPWASVQFVTSAAHIVVVDEDVYQKHLQSAAVAADAIIGASQPVAAFIRFADTVREARWALEGAKASQVRCTEYGTHGSYFLPRTITEGEAVVRRLLGPIIDYDEANGTELLRSLWIYFDSNRSWQEGARRLGIHKQTLTYRMKKVEELTAAGMRDFGAQAELYMALRTWRILSEPR